MMYIEEEYLNDPQFAIEKLWCEHIAKAIYDAEIFDEKQYHELLRMIYSELIKRSKRRKKGKNERDESISSVG